MAKVILDFVPNAAERETPLAPVKLGCDVRQTIAQAVAEAVRLEGLGLNQAEQNECVTTAFGAVVSRWLQLGYRLAGSQLVPTDPPPIYPYEEQAKTVEATARRLLDEAVANAVGHCRAMALGKQQRQRLVGVCPHCRCSHCET